MFSTKFAAVQTSVWRLTFDSSRSRRRFYNIGFRAKKHVNVISLFRNTTSSSINMGNYWLLKTEPHCWSWENQSANNGLSVWDGVRNHQAQKAMRNMAVGDLCFFYHTGKLKEVCGIVRVVKTFYPDPTDETEKWGAVDVQEVLPMKSNVALAQMKEDDDIADFLMFRQPRLSVVPVEEKVWVRVCNMGEVQPPLLDSSGDIEEEEVQATNGSRKRTAEPKAAPAEKQNRKSARGRKKAAENEEPTKVAKKQSSKPKASSAVAKEVDKWNATTAKKSSSARSRINGKGMGKNAEPAKVVKKRGNQSKLPLDEEVKVPAARATKKRASQANFVSGDEKGEAKPAKPS